MTYDHWRARLAIAEKYSTVAERRAAVAALKINFMRVTVEDEGYYRKPITEKHATNGSNIITGWIPVAYFLHNGVMVGTIGVGESARDLTDQELLDEEIWSWVVANPISYELYQGVVEHGDVWPDLRPPENGTPDLVNGGKTSYSTYPDERRDRNGKPREVALGDNKPPELPPHVEHATAIDNAIGAGKDLPVTTVAEAALAAGAANLIRDRRLAAEKVAKRKVEPLKDAYETERGNWSPPILRAKAAEDGIRKKVSDFERDEQRRIAAEQLAAMDRQREQDEAHARAADRAIAAGEPEQPPVVEEVVIPQAAQPVKPTYGSYKPAAKPLRKFAVITDDVAVYKYFAEAPDIKELLQRFATHAVRQGHEVPGATVREGTE